MYLFDEFRLRFLIFLLEYIKTKVYNLFNNFLFVQCTKNFEKTRKKYISSSTYYTKKKVIINMYVLKQNVYFSKSKMIKKQDRVPCCHFLHFLSHLHLQLKQLCINRHQYRSLLSSFIHKQTHKNSDNCMPNYKSVPYLSSHRFCPD